MDNGLRLERVAGALNGIKVCLESGAAPGNISEYCNMIMMMCIREDSDSLQWQSWPGSGLGS